MTLLSLEQFRRILGYNPFHFWGLSYDSGAARVSSSCNTVVKQYAWQNADAVGRAEILDAIEQAESQLSRYLGYSVAPRYEIETVPWAHYRDASLLRSAPIDSTGRWTSVQLPHGYVQAIGIEARTLIQAGVAVTYSDADGDGLNDLATISVVTSVTDANEIAAYYVSGDRFGDTTLSERWRIQPLTITISGGTATIKAPAWIFIDPIRYEGVSTEDLDPTVAANYVATVDIYRRYTNTEGTTNSTAQAMLIWETRPCGGWWCCSCSDATYDPTDSSGDPAARALAIARAGIRNSQSGIIYPAQAAYNTSSGLWSEVGFAPGYEPDRVTVRYLAGLPLENGQMSPYWQKVVARLAAAELSRRICACEAANRELYRWQSDASQANTGTDDIVGAISADDINNPLGSRRGHFYAWRAIQKEWNLRGFLP